MLLEWWCGVSEDHCLREEALPQSADAGVDAPLPQSAVAGVDAVLPARWEGGDESMVRVGGILHDVSHPAQAAPVINVLDGG